MLSKIQKRLRDPGKIPPYIYRHILRDRLLVPIHYYTGFGNVGLPRKNAIIMYHSVGGPSDLGLFGNISHDKFIQDLKYLMDYYEIVPLTKILEEGSQPKAAITFDDGLINFYENVFPATEKFGIPATVFVNPAFIGDQNMKLIISRHKLTGQNNQQIVMDKQQLQELVNSRYVDIGNHTKTHPHLSEINDIVALKNEIIGSKESLENAFEISIKTFCYPYGDYTEEAKRIVQQSHDLAVTTVPGQIDRNGDCFEVPRLKGHKNHPDLRWQLSRMSHHL